MVECTIKASCSARVSDNSICILSFCGNQTRYSKFQIWPWKCIVKVMAKLKIKWSHLRHRVQSICLLFVSWQSDYFWPRYSRFHIWPWKSNFKVTAKVKSDGHIWGLDFDRYVCFLFRGNGTIFGRDIANSIFYLENARSRSRRKSQKSNQVGQVQQSKN